MLLSFHQKVLNGYSYIHYEYLSKASFVKKDTYKLDPADLAHGRLAGVQYGTRLSAHDCFELGRQSYNANDHDHSDQWMAQALRILDSDEGNAPTVDRADVLEYMAFSAYVRGNMRRALKITDQLLAINPDHPRAAGNRKYYEGALTSEGATERKKGEDGLGDADVNDQVTVAEEDDNQESGLKVAFNEHKAYKKLCRGEDWMNEE